MAEGRQRVRPLGHEPLVRGLWRAARSGRLGHALLFHGQPGIGKYTAARWFAQGLYCARGIPDERGEPCGACGPCKRFQSDNHLDVLEIDVAHEDVPEKERQEHIKIDRIVRRAGPTAWEGPVVEEFLGLRAAEGGWRLVLVREAERLTHSQGEAQNAMLKMLEEPGESVLWILETSRLQALLPTIRSRCVPVPFQPLDAALVAQVLAAHGLAQDEAAVLARWAGGSPGQALDLHARGARAMRELLVGVLSGALPPFAAARALWELEGRFEGRTPTAQARDRGRAVLDLALDVVADLGRLAAGAEPGRLAHGDLAGLVRPWTDQRERLDGLLQARADIELNLDPPMLLDEAFAVLGGRSYDPAAEAGPRRPVRPT